MSLMDGIGTGQYRVASSNGRGSATFVDVFADTPGIATMLMADVWGQGARTLGYGRYLRRAVRALADSHSPARVLERVNVSFIRHVPASAEYVRRAALFLASRRGPVLTYASAGHDAALLVSAKWHRHLPRTGLHLGIDDRKRYHETRLTVENGAWLVVVTDGVTRAQDRRGGAFGTRGVVDSATSAIAAQLDDPAAAILEAARTHASGRLGEDASVLCVRFP